jgi:cytidyltransferase-like protein
MAGINNLKEVYEKKGEEFLKSLLNSYVIINEKVDGTFFGVKKNKSDDFKYFKKSGEISYVDRVLMKYYNHAISYFESISPEKRQRIPSNFYFGFEYFTNNDTVSSKYDRLPKNHLILSYIHKMDDAGNVVATVQNKEQLDRWADYLGVERSPIVFEGRLTDEQKSAILEFVYSPADELNQKFKTTSFTKYILSILNEELPTSFLKNNLDGNIETLVFRFYNEASEESVFLAKLVDPIFNYKVSTNTKPKENRSQDYIWLIVIDLMNNFELYSLEELQKMCEKGETFDEKYVSLVNAVFKDFIKEYAGKYEGLSLEVPEYLKRPEFELDSSLIKDPEITRLLKNNETYSEIYKILLNFFRKTRKKSSSGFFSPQLLTQLNLIVTKLKNVIMGDTVYESLFPSFSEFVGSSNEETILSEKEVAEGAYKKVEAIPVNLLIGSFQPVTMGHIRAAEKLKAKNGNKTIFVAIKPDAQNKKSPFSLKETRTMLAKTQQEYPEIIADVRIIAGGQLEDILEVIQPEYTPLLWGTSESRMKDYVLQLDYVKKKNIPLRLSSEFKLVELPIFVKSDDVINAIRTSDFTKFKKLVPTAIAGEFFNLQKELELRVNEVVTEVTDLILEEKIITPLLDSKLTESDVKEDSI